MWDQEEYSVELAPDVQIFRVDTGEGRKRVQLYGRNYSWVGTARQEQEYIAE